MSTTSFVCVTGVASDSHMTETACTQLIRTTNDGGIYCTTQRTDRQTDRQTDGRGLYARCMSGAR